MSNTATLLRMLLSYEYKVRLLRIGNEGVA